MNRRGLLWALAAAASGSAVDAARAQTNTVGGWPKPDETIDLWPAGALPSPSSTPPLTETIKDMGDAAFHDRVASGVTRPRLSLFKPLRPNGAAILLIPGGSYKVVGIDREGWEIAHWLRERGYTVAVLLYRLPGEGWAKRAETPLADAQRAMRLFRRRAASLGVADTISVLGLSAGGHLAASLALWPDQPTYAPIDDADQISAAPSRLALVYPVISMETPFANAGSRDNLLGPAPTPDIVARYSLQNAVGAATPPTFIVACQDDAAVPIENSLMFTAALRKAKRPFELHVFAQGGHGFGYRRALSKPVGVWLDLYLAWLRSQA